MDLVSVLVPVPSADALVSLLTVHEELSPSHAWIPASRQAQNIPAVSEGEMWGKHSLLLASSGAKPMLVVNEETQGFGAVLSTGDKRAAGKTLPHHGQ